MLTEQTLTDALRTIASALETPVILILLLLIAAAIAMLGTLIAECFTERRYFNRDLPRLLSELEAQNAPLYDVISNAKLLKSQRSILLTISSKTDLSPLKREALAGDLIAAEKARYELRIKITDLVMKLGPMFGLLGTLIPLGPGIIALGRGDTYTLSTSLLTAFDTTIAGLIAAALATVLSAVRKRWYARYMGQLGAIAESLLEAMEENDETA